MAHKKLLLRSAAREKIWNGATALAHAVRATLDPRWGNALVCSGGVTIVNEFDLKAPKANLGAKLICQASEPTGTAPGGGTNTSAVLAHALFAKALRNVAVGASANNLNSVQERGLCRSGDERIGNLILSRALESQLGRLLKIWRSMRNIPGIAPAKSMDF